MGDEGPGEVPGRVGVREPDICCFCPSAVVGRGVGGRRLPLPDVVWRRSDPLEEYVVVKDEADVG